MALAMLRYMPQSQTNDSKLQFPAFFRTTISFVKQAFLTSLDVKSLSHYHKGPTVYMFPNMVFITKPHNADEELHVYANKQFGITDYFQWPQLYAKEFCYAICICHREHYPIPDPLSWAWYWPTHDDFEPLSHAAFLIGKLKEEKAIGVATLHKIMSDCYNKWKKLLSSMSGKCTQN